MTDKTLVERARGKAADLRALNKRDAPTPVMRLLEDMADRIEELEEDLSIWKSVFPDIAPERVLPDRSKLEAENARLRALTEWRPIDEADKVSGVEIIGTRWAGGKCIREPFVSFWSPTLNKFYCDPTHFVPLPAPPTEEG